MKLFVINILILLGTSIYGQTIINIYAPDFKGKYVTLNKPSDLITNKKDKLNRQEIDSLGFANFLIETDRPLKTYIEIGSTSAFLYIDPSTPKYKVFFPYDKTSSQKIKGNTVELLFDSLAKNDLNTLILELNYRIDNFLFGDSVRMQRLILQDDSFKDSINEFKKLLIKEYKPIKNKYFHEYIKYSVAGIEQLYMARGMLKNKIYLFEVYINDYNILYDNDAYMNFFKQNFDSFFYTNIGLIDKIKHAINDYSSADKLDEVLVNSLFLKNDSIRELVTIQNLYQSYYKNSFNTQNIIAILKQIKNKTINKNHKLILTNILLQINALKVNTKAPNLNLITFTNDTIEVSDFNGKYIYLQFFSIENQSALQEIKIMKDMYSKYGKYIEFVSISLDDNENEYIRFKEEHPEYKWKFAHYKGENEILQNYKILNLPTYVLIDENGNIEQAQAMSPAPNYPRPSIDKTFFYIKKKREPKNTRSIGGKQN